MGYQQEPSEASHNFHSGGPLNIIEKMLDFSEICAK